MRIGIQQAINMLLGAGAALGGKAGGFVEDNRRAVSVDHHSLGQSHLCLAQRFDHAARARCSGGGRTCRWHPQDLSRGQTVRWIGALTIHPQLSGARPAADHRKADLGQVAFKPAVEADVPVVGTDDKLSNAIRADGKLPHSFRHRITANPKNKAAKPASKDRPT